MKFARLALALAVVAALAGCSSPDERAHEFQVWAGTLEYVASVEASPGSATSDADGMTAHLVVDGAIDAGGLVALTQSLHERADSQAIPSPDINLIVGNAWGFSADDAAVNVATINTLRDDPLFVGATVWYQPLDDANDYAGGLHGIVGSQAGLRDAPAALVAAFTAAGGTIDGAPVSVSTADGKFGISGDGSAEPTAAIALWQAISERVLPVGAHALLVGSGESLELTVASDADLATAQAIGQQHPDVTLTVTR